MTNDAPCRSNKGIELYINGISVETDSDHLIFFERPYLIRVGSLSFYRLLTILLILGISDNVGLSARVCFRSIFFELTFCFSFSIYF
jgi:hypothetical protein